MMQKQSITIAVLFGGKSQEHPISLMSARSVIARLDPKKYDIMAIGIDYSGRWWWQSDALCLNALTKPESIALDHNARQVALIPGEKKQCITLDRTDEVIKQIDVAFPVLHGPYGEDGTVQAMLEGANIPYVGSDLASCAVCMDKYLLKCILKQADLPYANFCTLKHTEYLADPTQLAAIAKRLDLPLFVKPTNLGSSIAVNKTYDLASLKVATEEAFEYTDHVLFEQYVPGRELECAVIGNHTLQTMRPAELHVLHDFYSYEAKYLDKNGAHFSVPADLRPDLQQQICQLAEAAYRAAGCSGLARVDFFITDQDQIIINEINTLPGFTSISLFPKMCADSGIAFSDLLDQLITFAFEKHQTRQALKVEYTPTDAPTHLSARSE